jgi:nicotinamide mononucleotide transporter
MITFDFWFIMELAAVITGLLCVYLTAKENVWCWPIGIVNVIIYMIVFFHARLFSDTLENFIYIPMQIWGWYYWLHGNKKSKKKDDDVPVTLLSGKQRLFWGLILTLVTIDLGFFMAGRGAALPYLDAFTTVMSLIAQWIMSFKKLESWILWITVDVLALFIYGTQGLYMTTGLYLVYLGLAIFGLVEWYRSYRKTKETQNGKS